MAFSPLFEKLTEALRTLPGVGPKGAQRMALHLLERDRVGGERIVDALSDALEKIGYCQQCRNLTEHECCELCSDARRDDRLLCIVESPADLMAIEEAGGYRGRYFVLHGHLSPLDGIGPDQIGLERLEQQISQGSFVEVVLATNPTVEGEATAHYISELLTPYGVNCSRLAYGMPLGGELEYVDGGTLARAFTGRLPYSSG